MKCNCDEINRMHACPLHGPWQPSPSAPDAGQPERGGYIMWPVDEYSGNTIGNTPRRSELAASRKPVAAPSAPASAAREWLVRAICEGYLKTQHLSSPLQIAQCIADRCEPVLAEQTRQLREQLAEATKWAICAYCGEKMPKYSDHKEYAAKLAEHTEHCPTHPVNQWLKAEQRAQAAEAERDKANKKLAALEKTIETGDSVWLKPYVEMSHQLQHEVERLDGELKLALTKIQHLVVD